MKSNTLIVLLTLCVIYSACNNENSNIQTNKYTTDIASSIDTIEANQNNPTSFEYDYVVTEENRLKLEGDSGIVEGVFLGAQQGDYKHISMKDTSEKYTGFYLGSEAEISLEKFYAMEDGKYNGRKVRVTWKKKNKYIEQIKGYEIIEEATKIEFIDPTSFKDDYVVTEKNMLKLEGDSGIVEGDFLGLELGAYMLISIKNRSGKFISFYLGSDAISSEEFEVMKDGKYYGQKVRVTWKKKNKNIEEINGHNIIEEATKIELIK